ncbi:MAG: ABC transporter ATP-binding protein [Anaerolineales bacterium]|nr:MAG: ABC transporter ATP-binding protein [Anaerolineales bacterium]
MIQAFNVDFFYPALQPGDAPQHVFSQLSLSLEDGATLAVMGVNGSGKSTLGYLVAGLAPRYTGGALTGDLRIAGENIQTHRPATGSIGLLFQDPAPQLFNTTVAYEVAWGLEAMGLPAQDITVRVKDALERFGMASHAQHPPWALSGGEQKRCALASLWAMRPRLLILDEPLNGLDVVGRRSLLSAIQFLRQSGTTILLMTHQQQAASIADAVVILEHGRVSAQQPAAQVLSHEVRLISAGLVYPQRLWPDLHRKTEHAPSQPAVEIRNVTFNYPDGRPALQNIDLAIPRGQFMAVVGSNGAGKSTLARHFNGLLHPTRGEVTIMGKKTTSCSTGALAHYVGFLFQRPEQQLFAVTVRDEIAYGPRNLKLDDAESLVTRALERFNLTAVASLPPAILSYGIQRTVTLACLAAMNSPIIVLDEPTVGLDGNGWRQLVAWLAELRASGTTIIIITHEMSLAFQADRVIVLDSGAVIADGLPADVLPHITRGGVDELYI